MVTVLNDTLSTHSQNLVHTTDRTVVKETWLPNRELANSIQRLKHLRSDCLLNAGYVSYNEN